MKGLGWGGLGLCREGAGEPWDGWEQGRYRSALGQEAGKEARKKIQAKRVGICMPV